MTTVHNKDKVIFPELSYKLTGVCFKVQDELGRFAREKQYCERLEAKFIDLGITFVREFTVKGTGNRVDFIVEDKILLEIKAQPFVSKTDYAQTQRYLQVLRLKLGLLINFQSKYLKPQRIINYNIQ